PEHISLNPPPRPRQRHAPPAAGIQLSFEQPPTLDDLEKKYLGILLENFDGHRGKVARTMGVSERNVYRLLRKHELMGN
ncbi:MAG: sigma-54-dependent Fis family transcriptional regulator, partial [Thiothrix sp.]|nr:sigma-54-dependent Fis family transcriptional regulator [Thiothrix sp.]